MSEMDDLKKGAEESKAVQQMQSISAYLDELSAECWKRLKWSLRCDTLEMFAMLGYVVILTTGVFMDTPEVFLRGALNWAFTVFIFSAIRSWSANKLWQKKEGEWDGAIKILQLMGMIPPDQERGAKKRRRTVSEFFGMVKAWAMQKKAAQEEIYAPA